MHSLRYKIKKERTVSLADFREREEDKLFCCDGLPWNYQLCS